jgi:hypothetical protein
MFTLKIDKNSENSDNFVDYLNYIAVQIQKGFTVGDSWEITSNSNKTRYSSKRFGKLHNIHNDPSFRYEITIAYCIGLIAGVLIVIWQLKNFQNY